MSAATLNSLQGAMEQLIATLGGTDVAAIERASETLAEAVRRLQGIRDMEPSPGMLKGVEDALDLTEVARVGTLLLQDSTMRRAEALALMRGDNRRAFAYRRDGRATITF